MAVAGFLLTGIIASGVASAHAVLLDSDPADGAELDSAPSEVSLTFNEAVDLPGEAIRAFDATGERVDTGGASHGNDRSVVRVGFDEDAGDGVYTVTWRVISADTHPISGTVSFTVGDPAATDAMPAPELADSGGQAVWEALATVLRWLIYLGALLAVGIGLFTVLVHDGRSRERARLMWWMRSAAVTAIAATAISVPVQAVVTSQAGAGAMIDRAVLAATLTSGFGISAAARVAGLLLLAYSAAAQRRPLLLALVSAGTLATLGSFLLAGHTASTEPRLLVLASNAAHTAAAAVWFGGLLALLLVIRTRRAAAEDATGSAQLVARFSLLAAAAVIVVALAGAGLAWAEVRSWHALVTTTYGWVLLVKILVVVAVLGVAAYNNRRLVPAIRHGATRAWHRLSRTVGAEVTGIAGVLAVTALLVSIVPARISVDVAAHDASHQEAGQHTHEHAEDGHTSGEGERTQHLELGTDHHLHLTVEPARAGSNDIEMTIVDRDGERADIAEDVELRFELPEAGIAALSRTPEQVGPAHYHHAGEELAIAGSWTVEVRVLVDEFERLITTTEVAIAPAQ
ncbi:copper resistance protein CopC [Haloechinothrix sp. LS1_15]|uniref:copper resistance CopC/CopD family protein n=1 Tax=Haloechinothrix sp. LS1_15 TaxID=2652248 RepID=UPI00294ABFB3|nr:copper resistance protein CopC [Haloechinothrix sp. LS1_15]